MTVPQFNFHQQTEADLEAVERLTERAFGPGRYAKTAYRLREGLAPNLTLSIVARVGSLLVGANRMSPIRIGDKKAVLLGPLVVEPAFRKLGLGEQLIQRSLMAAERAGYALVLLVGDENYYQRSGFKIAPAGRFVMPGPVNPQRLLYCELQPNALAEYSGDILRLD